MQDLVSEARTKILIAEDDAIVALDLQGMVSRLGYDVVAIVENGQTAVAAAHRFLPDIILLDMQLSGGIDGIEVAKKIHETSSTPIIFCITSPDLSALLRAKDISYAGYLLKPINPDSLATTLDTVLYKYKLEKRAEIAEDRFRKLAETCDVLQFFMESESAYRWSRVPGGEPIIVDFPGSSEALRELTSKIRFLAENALGSPDNVARRVATLLSLESAGVKATYAVLGSSGSEEGSFIGLVIPLDGTNI